MEENKKTKQPEKFADLSRHQKLLMGIFSLMTVVFLVIFITSFNNKLLIPLPEFEAPAVTAVAEEDPLSDPEKLKTQDTDEDGLSDYEELTIWYTSPYIGDSDSDGVSDFDEISRGEDPNCPQGQFCSGVISSNAIGDLLGDTSVLTGDQIRQVLLETGEFNQEDLSVLTDVQLLTLYDEIQLEAEIETTETEGIVYSPEQLREVLLDSGVSQTELDQLSDEELLAYYQQILTEIEN